MTAFFALLAFDVRLSFRRGADTMVVVGFFFLTVVLFSLAFRGDTALLARIAPGLVWVTALLAAMLALDRLFLADFEDGSLDQLLLSEIPLELVVLAKAAAHWITTGLPLIAVAPVLALVLNMNGAGLAHLALSLALGTPALTLIGAIGAALTLGARRGGVLISLLVLPLYIPVLIFGVGVVTAAIDGIDASTPIMALGGFLLGALALAPLASAAALRQAAR
ncbi:MAG: heme exporter protein CcmB [Alphaproteobacteria bacterium]